MIFEDKTIILRDGRTAVLRTPRPEDAEKMLTGIREASGETDYLSRYPEEWDSITVEGEEKWIRNGRDSQDLLPIACYIGNRIAGSCEIRFNRGIKTAHRAVVAIALRKEYWNLGIGSAMFTELISAAEARPGVEIVELEFVEGNDRAKALYEKFGFIIVGERPRAYRLKDGRMLTEYFMQKKLERA